MTEQERIAKVAELQTFFPNYSIKPKVQHVYGHTVCTIPFAVSFDWTIVRRSVVIEVLENMIYRIQSMIDDMPEEEKEDEITKTNNL